MGNSGKRFLALLLALVCVVGLLPTGPVWAAEQETQVLTQADYAEVDAIFDLIDADEAAPAKKNATQEEKTQAAINRVMASDSYVEDSLVQSGSSFTWWTDSGIRCIYSPRMRK